MNPKDEKASSISEEKEAQPSTDRGNQKDDRRGKGQGEPLEKIREALEDQNTRNQINDDRRAHRAARKKASHEALSQALSTAQRRSR